MTIIDILIKNGWTEGNGCYYYENNEGIWYYNTESKTLSYAENNNSPEEYITDINNYEDIEKYL